MALAAFSLPPLIYAAGLVVAALLVAVLFVGIHPPLTKRTILGFAPWMVLGANLHVLHQLGVFPPWAAPLFGSPAVYFTTFAVAVGLLDLTTVVAEARGAARVIPRVIGAVGTFLMTVVLAWTVVYGFEYGATYNDMYWPLFALIVAGVVTTVAYVLFSLKFTSAAVRCGILGVFVVFAHALDGVSTAVGIDILGVGERMPASAAILDFSATLPTAPYIGAGWLFVVIKVALALVIIWVFSDFIEENERQGLILLGVVAAVGLGPAVNNLLLFAVTG